ncbi:DUF4282 domain-containing protein [Actinomadura sediminis]|uniref:DUF4282 domain-containing protein n=1 Tax=Actinomadura sediminis TaxID=1038904 RepID=A0ABW3EM33_9ACTN
MTNPSDPGQPARPPAGGQPPGGPYGPPPPPHPQQQQQHQHGTGPIPVPNPRPPAAPPGQGHGQGQPNPNQPGPGPYATGPQPQVPPQGWASPPRRKGLVGALFDTSFDYMITAEMIKIIYRLAVVLITLFALIIAWTGVGFLEWNQMLGVLTILATPIIWLFQLVTTRMALEFLINQFKISEYLRVIKDKS